MEKSFFLYLFVLVFSVQCITVSSMYDGSKERKSKSYLEKNFFPANNQYIQYTGRIDFSSPKALKFDWPGVSITIKFFGTSCGFVLEDGGNNYEVILDGEERGTLVTKLDQEFYPFLSELSEGEHIVELYKRTEGSFGTGIFKGVVLSQGAMLLPLTKLQRKIEFIGDSITCGYGNEGSSPHCNSLRPYENNYLAFGPITARYFGAESHIIAISGKGIVHNYGDVKMISDQPLPYFYDRVLQNNSKKWNFKKWQPNIVVLALGSNDYSTGTLPDAKTFIASYQSFVKKIRKKNPNAHIICLVTRSNKSVLVNNIRKATDKLRQKDTKVFFLSLPVLDSNEVGCDFHPNVSQHKRIAKILIDFIKTNIWSSNQKL